MPVLDTNPHSPESKNPGSQPSDGNEPEGQGKVARQVILVQAAVVKKKICLLGSYGVGKTKVLVARFVHSMFADKYHTTVGVKIDKKVLDVGGQEVTLMLWDMAGEEEGAPVKLNQVKDASGYLLVADGTRSKTLSMWPEPSSNASESEIGLRPFLLLVNKADLREMWEISDNTWADFAMQLWLDRNRDQRQIRTARRRGFRHAVFAHAGSHSRCLRNRRLTISSRRWTSPFSSSFPPACSRLSAVCPSGCKHRPGT